MAIVTSIWTHKDFNWALEGRVNRKLLTENDYATKMWSEEYFSAMKDAIGLAKTSASNMVLSLRNWQFCDAGKHLLNAVIVLIKMGVNIELGNFVKGFVGAFISLGKTVWHTGAVLAHLFGALILGGDHLAKAKENVALILKDIVSLITCVGHAIPSWLPLVLLYAIPPVGVVFSVVKVLAQYTGIFDVLAYGGTAILLYAKYRVALATPDEEISKKTIAAWAKLKNDLNPFKSFEGATLGMYAVHVVMEGVATIASIFLPGVATAITYTSWGIQGAIGVGLYGNLLVNRNTDEQATA